MSEDDIRLPQVPTTKANDAEDVAWALSTAEAMWARGEHAEGLKWIRKAAEGAADAEDDERALDLAKAASDLAAVIARRSLASAPSLDGSPPTAHAATPPGPRRTASAPQKLAFPSPSRVGPAASLSQTLASTPRPPIVSPRPFAAVKAPAPPAVAPTAPAGPIAVSAPASSQPKHVRPVLPALDGDSEATMVGQVQSYVDSPVHTRPRGIDDESWTAAPPPDAASGDRMTSLGEVPPTTPRPSLHTVGGRHDPEISTSQAVRVVVWRDASGVHVAPSGTVVSAITVEAVLVALEPNADLTAWLSRQR